MKEAGRSQAHKVLVRGGVCEDWIWPMSLAGDLHGNSQWDLGQKLEWMD